MLIGNKQNFAIECYHEPISTEGKHIFGRMCLHVSGAELGDVNEPTCILNVTKGHLLDAIKNLDSLYDEELSNRSDQMLFDYLNQALYLDDDRTDEEVRIDAQKYSKFDFLTNGGESFDGTKSFIISDSNNVRLIFTDLNDKFHSANIPKDTFIQVVMKFIDWFKDEERRIIG